MRTSLPVCALMAVSILIAAGCGGGDDGEDGGGDGAERAVRAEPNSVAVIDPKTNRIIAAVPVEGGPARLAVSEGNVSVLSSDARTISLIDAKTHAVVKTLAVEALAIDLAAGAESLWVGSRGIGPPTEVEDAARAPGSVVQLDPKGGGVVRTIDAPPLPSPPASVSDMGAIAFGAEAVWFLSGNQTVSRIDPASASVAARIRFGGAVTGVEGAFVAIGEGGLWVSAAGGPGGGVVTRINPETNTRAASLEIPAMGPVAAGLGGVWVADKWYDSESVWQIDPRANRQVRSIEIGPLFGIAVGEGAVWATSSDGVVSRIDPTSGDVVAKIRVDGTPSGIAVGEGFVWVAVA